MIGLLISLAPAFVIFAIVHKRISVHAVIDEVEEFQNAVEMSRELWCSLLMLQGSRRHPYTVYGQNAVSDGGEPVAPPNESHQNAIILRNTAVVHSEFVVRFQWHILALDAFVRTNRRAIAMTFVCPSVCLSGTACIVIIRCILARI